LGVVFDPLLGQLRTTDSGLFVLKAGDTMTGALNIQPTIISTAPLLYVNALTGSSNNIFQVALSGSNLLSVSTGGTLVSKTQLPANNLSYNSGGTSNYWSNLYAQRLNLNSTAYLDGGTAGNITAQLGAGSGRMFFTTTGTTGSVTSNMVMNNADTGSAGAGMLISAGSTTAFIGGIAAQRSDITNTNSLMTFRILVNGTLSPSDITAPMFIQGNTTAHTTIGVNADIVPQTNATYLLGGTSNYFSNSYITRQNFNSVAYLDGATTGEINSSGNIRITKSGPRIFLNDTSIVAGALTEVAGQLLDFGVNYLQLLGAGNQVTGNPEALFRIDTRSSHAYELFSILYAATGGGAQSSIFHISNQGYIGLGTSTSTQTHPLTFDSTALAGAAWYNTSDEVTNYERVTMGWVSNVFNIRAGLGGTGTQRSIQIATTNRGFLVNDNTSGNVGFFDFNPNTTSATGTAVVTIRGASSAAGGVAAWFGITPTINQTSTAGYTALLVNPTETAVGSGVKKLIDLQVGGSSKWSVRNDGVEFPVQAPTASAPAYALGGVYFDTTLSKLRVGGASGWETITSA
jgi:hypothetical protein